MLDDADRLVLGFVAMHPAVLSLHVAMLLATDEPDAIVRLDGLVASGVLRRAPRLPHQQAAVQITRAGLEAIGSGLPVPELDVRGYRRDLAVAWVWLAARDGVFGPLDATFTRREMIAADSTASSRVEGDWSPTLRAKLEDRTFGVDVPGQQTRYPDLICVNKYGRMALDVMLTTPPVAELDAALEAYRAKPTIVVVLFLGSDERVGAAVRRAIERHAYDRAHVQVYRMSPRGEG